MPHSVLYGDCRLLYELYPAVALLKALEIRRSPIEQAFRGNRSGDRQIQVD
jgi:hypothetical protein